MDCDNNTSQPNWRLWLANWAELGNIKVTISDSLDWKTVHTLLQNIHFHECNEKFWKVPLYCKPVRTMTPVKQKDVKGQTLVNPDASFLKEVVTSDKVSNSLPSVSQSENDTDSYVNDFVFSDFIHVKTPYSDNDSQKRKIVSPVEQEKLKKKKNSKVNN